MKRGIYFLLALLLIFSINSSIAQIPRVISYQGMLLGSNEQPVPEGQYKLTFRIYNESNNLLWAETHNQVFITGGMFNVFLGTLAPLNLPFEKPYFLGIQVASDPELQPRMPLTSAAYCFSAGQVLGISNVFPADGNVGIGTLNPHPQHKLHVAGLARFDLPSGQINISTPGGWPGLIAFSPNGHRRDISFWDGGLDLTASSSSAPPSATNGITIDEDGELGIGTSFPTAKLDIAFGATGSIKAGTPLGQGPGWIMMAPNGHRRDIVAGTPGFYIGVSTTSAAPPTDFIIAEGGKVGIGLPGTNPGNILTIVQNSATDPIADAWTTYSSKRWKTNIKPIENALEMVQRLRGVTFDWKKDGKHDIGLVAEEVGQVIPEVVAFERNKKDAKSVDYSRLVALLIEAVKAQQKEIESLKATVELLRAE